MTAETVTTNTPDDVQAQGKPPLDEIMLAMKWSIPCAVGSAWVEREPDSDSREQEYEAASSQDLCRSASVPDHVLKVSRRWEERFVYKSPRKVSPHDTHLLSLAAAGVNGFSAASPHCCSPGSPTTSC